MQVQLDHSGGIDAEVVFRLIYADATASEAATRLAYLLKGRPNLPALVNGRCILTTDLQVRDFASLLRPKGQDQKVLRDSITRSLNPVLTAMRAAAAHRHGEARRDSKWPLQCVLLLNLTACSCIAQAALHKQLRSR